MLKRSFNPFPDLTEEDIIAFYFVLIALFHNLFFIP